MVKQWKQSLEQSDILSDGTPFDGANIDAPISSAGQGVDWASKTPKLGASGNTANTNTDIVSVTGSGYLLHVNFSADSKDNQVRIEVDGTNLGSEPRLDGVGGVNTTASENNAAVSLSMIWRFDSGFKIGTGSFIDSGVTSGGAIYVLD